MLDGHAALARQHEGVELLLEHHPLRAAVRVDEVKARLVLRVPQRRLHYLEHGSDARAAADHANVLRRHLVLASELERALPHVLDVSDGAFQLQRLSNHHAAHVRAHLPLLARHAVHFHYELHGPDLEVVGDGRVRASDRLARVLLRGVHHKVLPRREPETHRLVGEGELQEDHIVGAVVPDHRLLRQGHHTLLARHERHGFLGRGLLGGGGGRRRRRAVVDDSDGERGQQFPRLLRVNGLKVGGRVLPRHHHDRVRASRVVLVVRRGIVHHSVHHEPAVLLRDVLLHLGHSHAREL
mmetsp:Transcript_51725/g.102589  ORF Transcript_51725/g.102589 Transcript_51725/m.102589 type:complete len:297 (-) Transcript_51725:1153-2043(-)